MKVRKAIKKPIPVEFMELEWSTKSQQDIIDWGNGKIRKGLDGGVIIDTLEGRMVANTGAFIMKGIEGEFWAVKDSVFHRTYEEIFD